jgi:hypothetical protein
VFGKYSKVKTDHLLVKVATEQQANAMKREKERAHASDREKEKEETCHNSTVVAPTMARPLFG